MTTLLLNGDYTPLKIVTRQKAIKLLVKDKATVVEAAGVIRAAGLTFPDPKVLALRKYIHVPRKAANTVSRKAVLFRDGATCVYCGAHATTIDHVIPRSKGGGHTWDNVVAACKPCNSKKSDRFLDQLGWEMERTPKTPSGSFWILIKAREVDPTWEQFLGS